MSGGVAISSWICEYLSLSIVCPLFVYESMLSEEEKSFLQVSPEEMDPVKSFFLNAIQAKSSVSCTCSIH